MKPIQNIRGGPRFFYLAILLILLVWSKDVWARDFSFERFSTSHGLEVWMVPQDFAETISIVVHVPIGSTQDPIGKEGLAHFVEHMLFTDNDGRDELDFFKELESHGGSANGYTTRTETVYTVVAPAKETRLALGWIQGLLFNHQFKEVAVNKERKIVLLESDLTPPEPIDYFYRIFQHLRLFDEPSFWEREFGVETDDREIGGTYESIQGVSLPDIQTFYEKNYGIHGTKLFITGRFDPRAVKQRVAKDFFFSEPLDQMNENTSPWEKKNVIRYRKGFRREVSFLSSGAQRYEERFKIAEPTQNDIMMLFFLRDFLREVFNDELRFKERTTYGVWTDLQIYKNTAYFRFGGDFAPEDYDRAGKFLRSTLEALQNGTFENTKFEEYRKRARDQLDLTTDSPEQRSGQFRRFFANQAIFDSFPDQDAIYDQVSPEAIQMFLAKHMVPDNQIRYLTFLSPLSKTSEAILSLIVIFAFWTILRIHWIRPLHLPDLRYLRKFRFSFVQFVIFWAFFFALYVFYQSGLYFLRSKLLWLYLPLGNYWLRLLIEFVIFAIWLFLSILPFTYFPRKILLLKDRLVIKFVTFRAWQFPYEQVVSAQEMRFPQIFRQPKALWTWPLAFGIFRPAIYLRLKGRPAFFFRTRNNRELLETLQKLKNPSSPEPVATPENSPQSV